MADFAYAVLMEPDDGSVRVVVPAFPEIATFADNAEEALAMARDAIERSMQYRREHHLDVPPSDADGARLERVVIGHSACVGAIAAKPPQVRAERSRSSVGENRVFCPTSIWKPCRFCA